MPLTGKPQREQLLRRDTTDTRRRSSRLAERVRSTPTRCTSGGARYAVGAAHAFIPRARPTESTMSEHCDRDRVARPCSTPASSRSRPRTGSTRSSSGPGRRSWPPTATPATGFCAYHDTHRVPVVHGVLRRRALRVAESRLQAGIEVVRQRDDRRVARARRGHHRSRESVSSGSRWYDPDNGEASPTSPRVRRSSVPGGRW